MEYTYKTSIVRGSLPVILALLVNVANLSCEDYVEINPPNNQLTGQVVFGDASTVNAAIIHIYSQLRDNALTSGNLSGIAYLMGHYTDELDLYSVSLPNVGHFYENNLLASDGSVNTIWNTGYNLIYAANNILEGVASSDSLSEGEKNRFLGEAYFIRAFIHFYLVNLFGDIPYIDTTDYRVNSVVSREDENTVYQKVVQDLILAKELLPIEDDSFTGVRPDRWAASTLLARAYLYGEEWSLALEEALDVINNSGHMLNTDLGQVFSKNSSETIWQFDTAASGANTLEAQTFIFTNGPPPNSALSEGFINGFEIGDSRLTEWVGSVTDGTDTWYYPFKYKLNTNTVSTEECSILFRLAELYLIGAEAQAQMGNMDNALDFINPIRTRANLEPFPAMDQTSLLDAIHRERRVELFTEQAHRFFDLKRSGRLDSELSPIKPNWQTTDRVLPIPDSELIMNPNLRPQNDGY